MRGTYLPVAALTVTLLAGGPVLAQTTGGTAGTAAGTPGTTTAVAPATTPLAPAPTVVHDEGGGGGGWGWIGLIGLFGLAGLRPRRGVVTPVNDLGLRPGTATGIDPIVGPGVGPGGTRL